jgi:heptaprenylglyceryl phosphate synthase
MAGNGKFAAVYIETHKDSLALQLEILGQNVISPAVEKYFLRNLLISLEMYFVQRDRKLEVSGGALQELRDAVDTLMHDDKAPVALAYLLELSADAFAELEANFAE